VLCNLEYGLSAAKPVTVLIGDAGTGKSTLVRAALESEVCRQVMCLFIDNPLTAGFALDRQVDGDIVREVCRDFDLGPSSAVTPPRPSHLALVSPDSVDPASPTQAAIS
jgi:GTPase SAR1 family protein